MEAVAAKVWGGHSGPPPLDRGAELRLKIVALLTFATASAATLYFNYSMTGGMAMPGRWTMSMMWMPMGDEFHSALIFTAMWLAMMIAMMLPSTLPMILLYRRVSAFRGEARLGRATFTLASGYFFVWTLFGVTAYLIGMVIARAAMHLDSVSRALPVAGGVALCIAGIYQLTPWKSACLNHCRDPLTTVAHHLQSGRFAALRLGLHHGLFCAGCCWGLMLIQLVLGVMSLPVMIAVAVVIALEKLIPRGEWIARATGVAAIALGITIAIRASSLA
jgi:predicted metal-binding membrane protein